MCKLFQDVQKKSGVELENIKLENVKLREKLEEVMSRNIHVTCNMYFVLCSLFPDFTLSNLLIKKRCRT